MLHGLEFELLNAYQRDFPLTLRPYAAIARRFHVGQRRVLDAFERLRESGALSRIGAVFAPGRIGVSTLVALEVPEHRLAAVAGGLNALEGINHSYEREHRFNLWVVATAANEAALTALLDEIEARAGTTLLDLRMIREYRIDLGFDMRDGTRPATPRAIFNAAPRILNPSERRLVAALQEGVPFADRPYRVLGACADLDESAVLQALAAWSADGTIRRFGVIVRHHELGYIANVMGVWHVPEALVDEMGERLARQPGVTLAYQRRVYATRWPYNLYCMVHGKERAAVTRRLDEIAHDTGLDLYPHARLFSRRRFKQTGARYVSMGPQAVAHG